MCLRWLQKVKTPEGTEIGMQELGLLFSQIPRPVNNIVWMDNKYITTTLTKYLSIFEDDKTDMERYVSEYYDCDNFAVALLGLIRGNKNYSHFPFGLCFVTTPEGTGHAINIFVDNKKDIYYLEPQTDEVWLVKSDRKGYNPFFMLM
jgi:hypothetical protein